MRDNYFLDTNIIVYLFDQNEPTKKKIAYQLVQAGLEDHHTFVSYQVVQEFINVSTKKFRRPLSFDDCKRFVETALIPLWRVYPSKELFIKAIDISERYKYSFYDSLIISSAIESSVDILYSEDLQDGQQIERVTIVNPFV
jgi:predicted nucleic acid-binding protein